jgi:uncharacterized protein YbjT (DUF2867 family)/lysophospholipase L1-like esterase
MYCLVVEQSKPTICIAVRLETIMTYLIIGATGNIGGRVVDRLLARGERPRVLVRDPDEARKRHGERVDVAVGDLTDATSLAPAFAGVDAVLLINTGVDLATRDAAVAQVAKEAGVRYLVKLSSKDVEQGVGTGQWHGRGEAAIRASGIAFAFIRPAGFMSNALGWAPMIRSEGVVRTPTSDGKIPFVHPDDIADVAAKVLIGREHDGQTLQLTGPEALSYAEMTAKIGAVIGEPITFQSISPSEARMGLIASGEPPPMADAIVSIWQAIREGRLAGVTGEVERILGRPAATFDEWVRQNASAFRPEGRPTPSAAPPLEPYATWAVAPSDYATPGAAGPPPPLSFTNKTLRNILQTSIGGEQLRVRFSNVYGTRPLVIDGAHVALAKTGSEIDTASDQALKIKGGQTFTVPAGADVWSDAVTMVVSPNTNLAVSVFVKAETPVRTWHQFGMQTNYMGQGNLLSAPNIAPPAGVSAPETTTAYYWVTGVDVYRGEATTVAVVIGDSNMDGFGSTPDANQRFTNCLARRVAAGTPGVGVVNAALSGNRLTLDGPLGESVQKRFARDVLGQSGVSHVIVHIGISDIGFGKLIPTQSPSAGDIIAALADIATRAKDQNVKVILGTLLPWKKAMLLGANFYSDEGEAKRVAVNRWIKENTALHRIVDFDAVVRDPDDPTSIKATFDFGDHLHCNDSGLEAMANAVDIGKLL